jgi:hypothetical protein
LTCRLLFQQKEKNKTIVSFFFYFPNYFRHFINRRYLVIEKKNFPFLFHLAKYY